MVGIIITLSTNLFRTFIIRRFMFVYFQTDLEDKRKERAVYFLFFCFTSAVYLLFHFPPANVIANLIFLYFITLIYEGRQKKKILITFLVYGINMICDIIAVYSCNNYIVGKTQNEMTVYITVFLIAVCEYVIEKFLVKNRKTDFVPLHWSILIAIPVISIVLLLVMIMNNLNHRIILVSISTGILIINLLIFYLYDILVSAYWKLEESAVFERQLASYSNQLNVMIQSEEKVTALRHDMKHHLNELLIMANRNKDREVVNYIQNMNTYFSNPCEYSRGGNKEVDSLINYMLNKAEEVLERVDYEINVPKELEIRSFDLTIIIGNLLENAIEAAKDAQEKWIEVSLNYERGMLFIRIRNSYSNAVQKRGENYITTKKKIEEHGIGLQNVKKVVDSYKGEMQIADQDNIFDVKIILYTLLMK